MVHYFIESALLSHGLVSICDQDLCKSAEGLSGKIVWMEQGQLRTGDMEAFCAFRGTGAARTRIPYQGMEKAVTEKQSGALTASGTMWACEKAGLPLAVTCGMGGLASGETKEKCRDIQALLVSPVSLIATAPKDMFDFKWTVQVMTEEGIRIYSRNTPVCGGFLFAGDEVRLKEVPGQPLAQPALFLNPIPEEKRLKDRELLRRAIEEGRRTEAAGGVFHPAVNRALDGATAGQSSQMQLFSLIENARWAETFA